MPDSLKEEQGGADMYNWPSQRRQPSNWKPRGTLLQRLSESGSRGSRKWRRQAQSNRRLEEAFRERDRESQLS